MKSVILSLFCVFILIYSKTDVNHIFDKFRQVYHRKYHTVAAQQKAFYTFKKNLKTVLKLNEKTKSEYDKTGIQSYHLNRYADLDPKEVFNQYGVSIKPYYYANTTQEYLKKYYESVNSLPIENMKLYNLDETEEIYDHFKKKFNKTNYIHPSVNQIHYLRFYKTLIELNNKRFNGDDEAFVEKDADIVKSPHTYFFNDK